MFEKMLPKPAVMEPFIDQPASGNSSPEHKISINSTVPLTPSLKRAGCEAQSLPTSISFEGCGAAISYHLGVIESMYQTYGHEYLSRSSIKFLGTSSGSIAALVVALGLDVALWKDRMFTAWEPMGFFCQADRYVGKILSEILIEAGADAYKRLENRLYISITKFFSRNVVVSKWNSNAHVKRTVLASCFIPVVMLRPVWFGSCFAVDGGFSNNCPRLEKSTVLVSPSRNKSSEIKPEIKLRFRDLIGAPKKQRYYELWALGIENGLDYFQPAVEHHHEAPDAPQPAQTACGRCYFWAMRQPCCMCARLFLFWIILLTQVPLVSRPLPFARQPAHSHTHMSTHPASLYAHISLRLASCGHAMRGRCCACRSAACAGAASTSTTCPWPAKTAAAAPARTCPWSTARCPRPQRPTPTPIPTAASRALPSDLMGRRATVCSGCRALRGDGAHRLCARCDTSPELAQETRTCRRRCGRCQAVRRGLLVWGVGSGFPRSGALHAACLCAERVRARSGCGALHAARNLIHIICNVQGKFERCRTLIARHALVVCALESPVLRVARQTDPPSARDPGGACALQHSRTTSGPASQRQFLDQARPVGQVQISFRVRPARFRLCQWPCRLAHPS